MNMPHLEPRDEGTKQSRAMVIDMGVVKALLAIASIAFGSMFWLGWQVKGTVADFSLQVSKVDNRLTALEARRPMRDQQFASIEATNDDQGRRITALEIANTTAVIGIGSLRERFDQGFADIVKRLDRIESAR
jgi:hypothetical protein